MKFLKNIKKFTLLTVFLFSEYSCFANYKDWHTQGCTITNPELRILQFSDSHVRNTTDADWLVTQLQKAIHANSPDLIVATGDLTKNGDPSEWSAFQKIMENIKPLPELLWGNHDMPLKQIAGKSIGKTRYLDVKNYRLVFIDTAWPGPIQGSYTSLPITEFAYLHNASRTEKSILIFSHHPLGESAPHFMLRNAKEVKNVFQKNQVLGVFSGHFHGAYFTEEKNILYAGTAPLNSHEFNHTFSQKKGYRLIELQQQCLRTKQILLD